MVIELIGFREIFAEFPVARVCGGNSHTCLTMPHHPGYAWQDLGLTGYTRKFHRLKQVRYGQSLGFLSNPWGGVLYGKDYHGHSHGLHGCKESSGHPLMDLCVSSRKYSVSQWVSLYMSEGPSWNSYWVMWSHIYLTLFKRSQNFWYPKCHILVKIMLGLIWLGSAFHLKFR